MRVILSTISALLRPAWILFTSSVHLSSVSLGFAFYGFVKSYDFSAKLTESIAISLEIPGASTSKALIFFFFFTLLNTKPGLYFSKLPHS